MLCSCCAVKSFSRVSRSSVVICNRRGSEYNVQLSECIELLSLTVRRDFSVASHHAQGASHLPALRYVRSSVAETTTAVYSMFVVSLENLFRQARMYVCVDRRCVKLHPLQLSTHLTDRRSLSTFRKLNPRSELFSQHIGFNTIKINNNETHALGRNFRQSKLVYGSRCTR